jgi:hypothetical protein
VLLVDNGNIKMPIVFAELNRAFQTWVLPSIYQLMSPDFEQKNKCRAVGG